MKKSMGCLLMAGAMSVCAAGFYGIEMVVGPGADLSGMIQGLLDGDRESAEAHLEHLAIVAPKLAKDLSLVDFELPCIDCATKRSMDCKVCGGRLLWLDPEALRYLQETFRMALENGEPVEKAWVFAKRMFDERKALMLSRKPFKGKVFRVEVDGLLIEGDDGKIFFLAEKEPPTLARGQACEGTCWLIKELSHSYREGDVYKSVSFHVRNLWWDY